MSDEIRLGVTGHRPHKLNQARLHIIAADLARVLAAAKSRFAPRPVACISSLAEGADTMAAKAALALGLRLVAPLPFPADDYAQDFADGPPRQTLHDLLARAEVSICTTGRAALDQDAFGYRAASMAMLDKSHALLAVWDGQYTHLLGGAFDTVSEALGRGMDVLWVDARGASPPRLLGAADLAALAAGGAPTGHGDETAFLDGLV